MIGIQEKAKKDLALTSLFIELDENGIIPRNLLQEESKRIQRIAVEWVYEYETEKYWRLDPKATDIVENQLEAEMDGVLQRLQSISEALDIALIPDLIKIIQTYDLPTEYDSELRFIEWFQKFHRPIKSIFEGIVNRALERGETVKRLQAISKTLESALIPNPIKIIQTYDLPTEHNLESIDRIQKKFGRPIINRRERKDGLMDKYLVGINAKHFREWGMLGKAHDFFMNTMFDRFSMVGNREADARPPKGIRRRQQRIFKILYFNTVLTPMLIQSVISLIPHDHPETENFSVGADHNNFWSSASSSSSSTEKSRAKSTPSHSLQM